MNKSISKTVFARLHSLLLTTNHRRYTKNFVKTISWLATEIPSQGFLKISSDFIQY